MIAFANQVGDYVPMRYTVLGTDGFGRLDTRVDLLTSALFSKTLKLTDRAVKRLFEASRPGR